MDIILRNIKRFSYPITVYITWRLAILIYQIFIQPYYIINKDSTSIYQRIFESWTTYWDAGHYLSIAQNGYSYPQQAFFPLWPLLIRIASINSIIPEQIIISILVWIFGLSSFILFYILAIRLVGKEAAKYALFIFATFPSSMFLIAGYTEAFFLTLVLSSFLLLEQKRYFLSALVAGFSSATRLVGIGLLCNFFFIKHSYSNKVFYILVGLIGLFMYMFFLELNYSDPFLFSKAQEYWCEISGKCQLTFPLLPLIDFTVLILTNRSQINSASYLDWLSAVVFLLLSIFVFTKLRINYFLYTLTVILLPLCTGSTVGMIRYIMVAFPIFYILPILIKSKIILIIIGIMLFLLQLRFIALFSSSMWVA